MRATNMHTCGRFPLAPKSRASAKCYLLSHNLGVLGRCAQVKRQAQTHTHSSMRLHAYGRKSLCKHLQRREPFPLDMQTGCESEDRLRNIQGSFDAI